ncbi:MAG TPA: hypothetical protein VFV02_16020 [Acidimicrobiales bacterium]|nr:hypothetical protein [Acidimicrobiales bacterium]
MPNRYCLFEEIVPIMNLVPASNDDEALSALADLIQVLDDNIRRSEQILERARYLRTLREAGLGWAKVVEGEKRPLIVEMLTMSIEELHEASARFRRAHARALRAEGMTIEQIAVCFRVSRQRISALLTSRVVPARTFGSYTRSGR